MYRIAIFPRLTTDGIETFLLIKNGSGKQVMPLLKEVEFADLDMDNLLFEILTGVWNRKTAMEIDFDKVSESKIEYDEGKGVTEKRKCIIVKLGLPSSIVFPHENKNIIAVTQKDLQNMISTGLLEGREVRIDPPHKRIFEKFLSFEAAEPSISP